MPRGQESTARSSHSGRAAHLGLTPATLGPTLVREPDLGFPRSNSARSNSAKPNSRPDPAPKPYSALRPNSRPDPDDLAALRAQIGAIERLGGRDDGEGAGPLSLGAVVDAALPWGGLPRDCLHEIVGGETAVGFAAALAARLAGEEGAVLWCLRPRAVFDAGHLHGPGLIQFGLDPGRLIIAQARSDQDLLWAMEEGLRSGRPAVVLGEVGEVGLAATRRLQLAAEMGGVTALLLRRRAARRNSSVAVTRWRVTPAPSGNAYESRCSKSPLPTLPLEKGGGVIFQREVLGTFAETPSGDAFSAGAISPGCWRVDLVRCRGGTPKSWLMEWRRPVPSENTPFGNTDDNANGTKSRRESFSPAQAPDPGGFAVVAELSDRPAEPAERQAAAS